MTISIEILPSTRNKKRFLAKFIKDDDIIKKVHFGQKGGETYIDHNDDEKKKNYLKRHVVNENWNDMYSAGALSRYILWNKPTLEESINDYKRRFNLF